MGLRVGGVSAGEAGAFDGLPPLLLVVVLELEVSTDMPCHGFWAPVRLTVAAAVAEDTVGCTGAAEAMGGAWTGEI